MIAELSPLNVVDDLVSPFAELLRRVDYRERAAGHGVEIRYAEVSKRSAVHLPPPEFEVASFL
jgi:hypothetical protein